MTDDDIIIAKILKREGGLTDRLDDPGGITNFGITLPALADWRGHLGTPSDIRTLTEADAWEFYRWLLEQSGATKIQNPLLRSVFFDAAVNHGNKAAVKMLQRALNVTPDGIFGPVTLAALPYLDARRLAARFMRERLMSYGRIISGNWTDADHDGKPDAAENGAGWINRVAEQLEELVA
jgi:type VI secretion system secreted protein VgrG